MENLGEADKEIVGRKDQIRREPGRERGQVAGESVEDKQTKSEDRVYWSCQYNPTKGLAPLM